MLSRILLPSGADFEPGGRLETAVAYGVVGDGREVCVIPRMFNTIVTIGPVGGQWFDDSW